MGAGPRRFTIRDVAARARVSEATVSRVLRGQSIHVREDTRRRVLRVATELRYQPSTAAVALRTSRTYAIGLVIPDLDNPIWPAVAHGVQQVARPAGFSVVLGVTDWEAQGEVDYLAMAQRGGFDGLLINPARATNDDLLRIGVPAVVLGSHIDFPDFDVVGVDTVLGIRDAIGHLVGLGHRRIGLIAPPLELNSGRKRYRGYRAGLTAHGLVERSEYVVAVPYSREGGAEALRRLIALPEPPTAVVAGNDQQAIGALHAARAAGLQVPADLSIVGLDDLDAASVTSPPLTTLRRPQREYGASATRMLIERISGLGPEQPRRILYPCELIVRETTAPPRSR
jgi:DNA-binding LacI/PurR family transcriptional regulator